MIKVKKILMPLPSYGFDPTEASIPAKMLIDMGHYIQIATPNGKKAEADKLMVSGERLGIWKGVLRAREDAVLAYQTLQTYPQFCNPICYEDAEESQFDAILLPGGHDKGMREYLESEILQRLVANFFRANKPVAAICHGVVLVARSVDANTQKSVIYDYQTTALLKSQELLAYNLTKWWLKDYYLTYPEITVEDEVKAALSDKKQFQQGKSPLFRDSPTQLQYGFCVRDRNYLSARWPGDVYTFSKALIEMLEE